MFDFSRFVFLVPVPTKTCLSLNYGTISPPFFCFYHIVQTISLAKCFVIVDSKLTRRDRSLHGPMLIVPCVLTFVIIYLTVSDEIFVIREIFIGDHSLLLQKCRTQILILSRINISLSHYFLKYKNCYIKQ